MPEKPLPEEEKEDEKKPSDTFNRVREYEVSVTMWPEDPPADESPFLPPKPKERSGVEPIRTPEEANKTPRRR